MDPLKITTLIPILIPAKSWVRRNLPAIIIAGAVLVDLAFILFVHYGGKVSQLLKDHPGLLSHHQVEQLQHTAEELAQQQAKSQRKADSTYAHAQAPEQDAARRQVLIHHLTTRYHAITPDTTRAAAAAAADYLRHYTPGAGPDADL